MAIENVVIAYKADINDIKRQVTLLQRLNKLTAEKLGKDFTKGAIIVRNELSKITTSAKQIKLPLGGVTNQVRQFTTILRGANGQLATVRQTVAGTGKNLKVLNTTVSKGATVTRTMGQNLATLAKRAALTIPLWFALRQGIGSVFRVMREGLTAIVDFDRALQKARRNLQGSAEEIQRNFTILRKEVTQLSLETGRSVEDITNAFQKFATVGFDFETSLAGANNATKLSILLFGDAQETATAFARSMRVLVDESEDARPAGEQLAEVMALTSELWKTNAFELNELTQSLEKFAPVAKTAGFSAEETVKVLSALSTAGLRGGRAGRLLRTSIVRLVTSTDKLASSLGIKVNPEIDRTFDVFLKTLDVLHETRSEAGKVAPEFEKVVKSIFGLRSSDAIKGLIALRKNLQDVLGVTGDVSEFNKEFEGVNKQVFQLVAQFRNLNREIGKAFVTGLVGGEDFRDSLEEIVELQKAIVKNARIVGKALAISTQITFGINAGAVDEIEKQVIRISDTSTRVFDEINKKSQESFEKLVRGINGQLNRLELEELIAEVDAKIKIGADPQRLDIPPEVLKRAREELEKRFEELPPIEVETKVSLDKIEITTEQQSKLIQDLIDDQIQRLKIDGATESQLLKIEDRLRRQFDVNDNILSQKQRQLDIERAINQEQQERIKFSNESVKLAEIAKTEGVQTAVAIGEVLRGQRDFNTFLRQGGERAEILKNQFADFVKGKELEQFFKGLRVLGEPGLRGGERIPIRELGGQARDITPLRATAEFQLAKARLGLKESTDENNTALQANTASLQSLIQAYNLGVQLRGTQAQEVVTGAVAQRQILDININVDGRDLSFSGTPEAIRRLAGNISTEVAQAVEDKLVNDLKTNNSSPISEATDQRIENF
jgi:TP901 family phage tail tape measure protein